MHKMKRHRSSILAIIMAIVGVFCFAPQGDAENEILKRECETKASQAAELIKKLGADAAFKKIADPNGPFVSETSHVFCINAENGTLLAHKVVRFVGSNMHYYRDADGNTPYTDMLERAKQEVGGWTTYVTYGSGPEKRKTPALKNMYFFKVPGENIVLCCGYWEDA